MTNQDDKEKFNQTNMNIFKIDFLDTKIVPQLLKKVDIHFEVCKIGEADVINSNFFWEIIRINVFDYNPFENKEVTLLKNLATG